MELEHKAYWTLFLDPDEMKGVKDYFERRHVELGKAGYKKMPKKDRDVVEMFKELFEQE